MVGPMQSTAQHAERKPVGIVGLGLIGGSFAKAYADAGFTVYGHDLDEGTLQASMAEKTVAAPLDSETLPACGLVIIALYPQATLDWLSANAASIARDALVIDCGGVKRAICEPCFSLADRHGFTFIGGHPMAGTHHSGYRHARGDLYAGQPMVLVLPDNASDDAIQRARQALAPAGFGSYSIASAQEHDRIIAYTSQLAHVVSSAFIKSPTAQLHKGFSAGSYKDLTRVAELNPDMWTQLFMANADYLGDEIDEVIAHLQEYRQALRDGQADRLHALLAEGSAAKLAADGRFPESQVN